MRTRDPRRARARAAEITALAVLNFFPTVVNRRLTPQQTQNLFRDVFTRHLEKLDAVVTRERMEPGFDAEDSRRSDRVALRNAGRRRKQRRARPQRQARANM